MGSEKKQSSGKELTTGLGWVAPAIEYMVDATQRSILFWDVMRQRGNAYHDHLAESAPHVLDYVAELVIDGRKLERPVNYALVRIVPPAGVEVDSARRPFVVVDPRAGHGPGIGGFKADSEIGVVLKAGHPCYFIGFLPEPMLGQTIEDIARAEAIFLEKIIALHPKAEGKPCVIGNCQAGWAVMMLAAIRPELFGPIIIAGAPLSYWAGVRGKNPMRYSGGLLGGSWLTALTSDIGRGKFDGAWLVQNFENLNPSNTFWTKPYNLFKNIDTEAPRYLGFERWWGGHVSLNAEEIQFIVDELFIGNKLAAGQIQTSDGTTIDLRNIRSPIVVFCSEGDNITPPQQALGWILDLFDDAEQIRSFGQTIIYTIHESVGHLGIFVSGQVARKEHSEFSSNIDLIDTLPPGLYEAIFEPKTDQTENPDLASGDWVMRCEPRTLEDIRRLGVNNVEDERRFATVARISEMNLASYRTWAQPIVRQLGNATDVEWMQRLHPQRLQYDLFSDANPLMAPVAVWAKWLRENRSPAAPDNPFLRLQERMSDLIVAGLDSWRKVQESLAEQLFLSIYGSPMLQQLAGIDPHSSRAQRKASKSLLHSQLLEKRIAELKSHVLKGGLRECVIRAFLYVAIARGRADERGFESIRRIRAESELKDKLPLAEFKALVREQYYILLIDQEAALEAIPALLPKDAEKRRDEFNLVRHVLSAYEMTGEAIERLKRIAQLFGVPEGSAVAADLTLVAPRAKHTRAQAS